MEQTAERQNYGLAGSPKLGLWTATLGLFAGLTSIVLTFASSIYPAILGMMILGTGMGVANAAVFQLVPKYIPDAVGGASGWIGGIGGAGTLVILPALGKFVDVYGNIGYARGFVVFIILSTLCAGISYALKKFAR